ncbi:MAG: DNA mismatch repair protein MutS [Ruminococcaceae bacterium]|nr:DNA mismatch repair protein MutS [Oscillospiraceae bacterium]
MAEMTPMMQQYLQIKEKHKDCIIFFRLGDFYEMFFDDAKLASKELELTLTGRDCGQKERAPMCGVPFHSYESYVARLVARGYKVAICEQTEDPAQAKGLVKRDIIRILTPGTVIEGSMLDEAKNNYLAVVCATADKKTYGLCFCDCSTGEIHLTQLFGEDLELRVVNELGRYSPSEILVNEYASDCKGIIEFSERRLNGHLEVRPAQDFDLSGAQEIILRQFKAVSLSALEVEDKPVAVCAFGCAIGYLQATQMTGLERMNKLDVYSDAQYMKLDLTARRNLELLETMRSQEKRGSLLGVLDHTKTAMGKRLLRSWIEQPLVQIAPISRRLNAVDELVHQSVFRSDLQEVLAEIYDLERIMTRVVYGSANGRELRSLYQTLSYMPSVRQILAQAESTELCAIRDAIDPLEDVCDLIAGAIVDEPPFTVREGGMIRPGYNAELDELTAIMTDGKGILTRIETEEKEKTGIKTLKVGYNRVFGYYIEISRLYSDQVPEHYIRKQTLANAERYITQELKELEARVLGAKDRAVALEYQLFTQIREAVAAQLLRIQATAEALAKLDVLISLAVTAVRYNYCRPEVDLSGRLSIIGGRHPVVEALSSAPFVPNDTNLDNGENRVALITGPNMAGKSTYMRQTALITLMAQIGSFVPAQSATIGIVDSIFTRVGASDDLAAGQSTFMVEMSEVASILRNATSKSLIVFDEIGRGTSTFDGMSIARAVLEYVANPKRIGAKTLFATHYHELTSIEEESDCIKNYNIAVKKRGDDVTFLRRIVRGPADDSYGIEVAKLAGINDEVVRRAKEILRSIEGGEAVPVKHRSAAQPVEQQDQLSLLTGMENPLIEKLKELDVNVLTPIEAMQALYDLVKEAQTY